MMLRMTQIRRDAARLIAGVAATALLEACGGATPATTLPASVPTVVPAAAVAAPTAAPVAPTVKPTEAPIAAPTEAPAAAEAQPAAGLASLDDALLAQGRILFEKDAGGVGCASCHGMDARGNEAIGAPDIQGRTDAQIRSALTGVDMMTPLKVKPDEVKAIAAYLNYLSTQP